MIIIFCFFLALAVGEALALLFGYWHIAIIRRRPIYQKEKYLWWIIKFVCVAALAYILPYEPVRNALVIGLTLWFMFDALLGHSLYKHAMATGTQSILDGLAHGKPWYFWTKFSLMIGSYIYYFI